MTANAPQQVTAVELHCQATRGLPTGLLADLGALVLAEVRTLQRAGRKTARLDDILNRAADRLARIDTIHGQTVCPCPNCRHHTTTAHHHTTEGDHHSATR